LLRTKKTFVVFDDLIAFYKEQDWASTKPQWLFPMESLSIVKFEEDYITLMFWTSNDLFTIQLAPTTSQHSKSLAQQLTILHEKFKATRHQLLTMKYGQLIQQPKYWENVVPIAMASHDHDQEELDQQKQSEAQQIQLRALPSEDPYQIQPSITTREMHNNKTNKSVRSKAKSQIPKL
jgi:hypothetical protein